MQDPLGPSTSGRDAAERGAPQAATLSVPVGVLDDPLGLGALTNNPTRERRMAPGGMRPRARPRPAPATAPTPEPSAAAPSAPDPAATSASAPPAAPQPPAEKSVPAERAAEAGASQPLPSVSARPALEPRQPAPPAASAPAAEDTQRLHDLAAASLLLQPRPEIPQPSPPTAAEDAAWAGDAHGLAPEQLLFRAVDSAAERDAGEAAAPGEAKAPRSKASRPKQPQARKRRTKAAAAGDAAEEDKAGNDGEAGPSKPKKPRKATSKAGKKRKAAGDKSGGADAPPAKKRTRRKKKAPPPAEGAAEGGDSLAIVVYEGPDADEPQERVVSKARKPKEPDDELMMELCPWRKKRGDKVDLEKEVTRDMTLDHIIRRANLQTRRLDEAAKKRAKEAKQAAEEKKKKDAAEAGPAKPAAQDLPTERATGSNVLAPQVKFVDGRIEVDQASLRVQASQQERMVAYQEEEDVPMNSLSFLPLSKLTKDRWTKEDTDVFYQVLMQFGTDFSIINHFFKQRTRKQIKNKYLKEHRLNPERIREALTGRYDEKAYKHLLSNLEESAATEKPGDAAGGPDGGSNAGGQEAALPAGLPPSVQDAHGEEDDMGFAY